MEWCWAYLDPSVRGRLMGILRRTRRKACLICRDEFKAYGKAMYCSKRCGARAWYERVRPTLLETRRKKRAQARKSKLAAMKTRPEISEKIDAKNTKNSERGQV